jgi:hypothetical protein
MINTIYITRKSDLTNLYADRDITLQEWMTFVLNDPEMRLDNHTTVTLANGELYRYANPGAAVFFQRATGQSAVREVVFDFIDGGIRIYNGDQPTIQKIKQIAFKLNAQIFQETKSYTLQIPLEREPNLRARFYFKDLLTPFKKLLPQLRYRFQHFAFSWFRHGQEKQLK